MAKFCGHCQAEFSTRDAYLAHLKRCFCGCPVRHYHPSKVERVRPFLAGVTTGIAIATIIALVTMAHVLMLP